MTKRRLDSLAERLRESPLAISRYRKTTHPNKPAIKLPTMELLKLTKSLFSQRQGAV